MAKTSPQTSSRAPIAKFRKDAVWGLKLKSLWSLGSSKNYSARDLALGSTFPVARTGITALCGLFL
jgi:hypothetical protein